MGISTHLKRERDTQEGQKKGIYENNTRVIIMCVYVFVF